VKGWLDRPEGHHLHHSQEIAATPPIDEIEGKWKSLLISSSTDDLLAACAMATVPLVLGLSS